MVIGQHLGRETADGRTGLLCRVMLCERRAGEFFFQMRSACAPQHNRGQMGDAV
jgi:hypothetical protein